MPALLTVPRLPSAVSPSLPPSRMNMEALKVAAGFLLVLPVMAVLFAAMAGAIALDAIGQKLGA